jgi:hypothetical protein
MRPLDFARGDEARLPTLRQVQLGATTYVHKSESGRKRGRGVNVMLDALIWLIKLPFLLLGWLIKAVVVVVVWLIKLPFVLIAVVLAVVLGLVGVIISALGVALTPVLGIGLLILPIGLILLLAGWVIARLL